jgi:phosphoribosylformylglycinamidine synthase
MTQPNALVLSGYGLNCEEETKKLAFERAGVKGDIVHINDIIANRNLLQNYQIMAFPGGFSYGDDTGSGNAMANKIRNNLGDELNKFVHENKLIIGICNGFQILVNLGLLPALDGKYGTRQVALAHNTNARYTIRWVDLKFEGKGPWLNGIETIALPIAHGEGRLYAESSVLKELNDKNLVAARYVKGHICNHFNLPANPNGSLEDIAGITDESGRILGMMPHPERAIEFTQLPHWTFLKESESRGKISLPTEGPGLQIFRNAMEYFK